MQGFRVTCNSSDTISFLSSTESSSNFCGNVQKPCVTENHRNRESVRTLCRAAITTNSDFSIQNKRNSICMISSFRAPTVDCHSLLTFQNSNFIAQKLITKYSRFPHLSIPSTNPYSFLQQAIPKGLSTLKIKSRSRSVCSIQSMNENEKLESFDKPVVLETGEFKNPSVANGTESPIQPPSLSQTSISNSNRQPRIRQKSTEVNNKFKSRRRSREIAVSIIFSALLSDTHPSLVFKKRMEGKFNAADVALNEMYDLKIHKWILSPLPEICETQSIVFIQSLVDKCCENWQTDSMIIRKLIPQFWTKDQSYFLPICGLRLAMVEISCLKTSHEVVINEMVELLKTFSDKKFESRNIVPSRMVNGCLSKYVKTLGMDKRKMGGVRAEEEDKNDKANDGDDDTYSLLSYDNVDPSELGWNEFYYE